MSGENKFQDTNDKEKTEKVNFSTDDNKQAIPVSDDQLSAVTGGVEFDAGSNASLKPEIF